MRAGDLRRRIDIQVRSTTQDALGQQSIVWTDYMTSVAADIQSLTGRERFIAQSASSQVTHTIVVRYCAQLADPLKVGGMRAVYTYNGVTRYFEIESSINVDERNEQIQMLASEGLKYV